MCQTARSVLGEQEDQQLLTAKIVGMTRFRQLALMVLVCACGAFLAYAAPNYETQQNNLEIVLSDLDLADEHDAQLALKRIESGAWKVCGHNEFVERFAAPTRSRCLKSAVQQAVGSLGSPMVIKVWRDQQHRETASLHSGYRD